MKGATDQPHAFSAAHYDKAEHWLVMRDGVRLRTHIYVPKDTQAAPILFTRTPYNIETRGFPCPTPERTDEVARSMDHFAREGYIIALQDIRGTHGSQGRFVLNHLSEAANPQPDEATDAHDSVAGLLGLDLPTNGRVGLFGFSYGGFTALAALVDKHPAIKAVSAGAAMADMFRGDDFYYNGALQLAQAVALTALLETGHAPAFDGKDAYSYFLSKDDVDALAERAGVAHLESWQALRRHASEDGFWRARRLADRLREADTPCLHTLGWFDVEDVVGALAVYQVMSRGPAGADQHLVIGPWRHGAWVFEDRGSRALGPLQFGMDTTADYQQHTEAPFFRTHLWGQGDEALAPVRAYEVPGQARWRTFDGWPPPTTVHRLYIAARGALSAEPPMDDSDQASDSYVSVPDVPLPYTAHPVGFYGGIGKGAAAQLDVRRRARALFALEDQRFLTGHGRHLDWFSPVLAADSVLAGPPVLELHARIDTTDIDWIVHLLDAYPDDHLEMPGYLFPVTRGILRASFARSMSEPRAVTPGTILPFTITCQDRLYRFAAGHRIGLRLQSTWFPMLARNPQAFNRLDSYAPPTRPPARVEVMRRTAAPTRLTLPLIGS